MKVQIVVFLLCLCSAFAARAWPTQPINLILPYSPGGLTDQIARSLAVEIEKRTKHAVIVQYMPGGTNLVALNHVERLSKNDHHTFILTMDDFILGSLHQDSGVYQRFTGVYVTSLLPFVVVSADPTKAMALRVPGKKPHNPNLAVVGLNSSADLWQKSLDRIEFNAVAYKGAAPALTDLLGGHIDYGVFSIGFAYPYIKDGKLHPVMISRSRRSPVLQNIPTSVELGYNGSEGITWFSFIARDDTDTVAQEQFNLLLQKIFTETNPLSFLSNNGAEVVNWNLERSKKFIQDQKHTYESRR